MMILVAVDGHQILVVVDDQGLIIGCCHQLWLTVAIAKIAMAIHGAIARITAHVALIDRILITVIIGAADADDGSCRAAGIRVVLMMMITAARMVGNIGRR